jgi:hypothetical protein
VRTRCRRADEELVELVGPRLSSPEDAVAALRLSAGTPDDESIIVLVCDEDQNVELAVDFAGGEVLDVVDAVGIVVEGLGGRTDLRLVVGLLFPGTSTVLDEEELEAVAELAVMCQAADVRLLDVLVVAREEWRSLAVG